MVLVLLDVILILDVKKAFRVGLKKCNVAFGAVGTCLLNEM